MKHCILAKFVPTVMESEKDTIADEVYQLFLPVLDLPGIYDLQVHRNCVAKQNRYDLLVEIEMEAESLSVYEECPVHALWKSHYGPLLECKAIFDFDQDAN